MKDINQQISINELHQYFYDCLKYFDDFCFKHNLRYIVMWGSLLGCVRDGGIIPWDGDVDLLMPYQDYDRLLSMKELFDNGLYELTFPDVLTKSYSNEMRIKINNVFWKQKHQFGSFDRRVAIDIFIATPLSKDEKTNLRLFKAGKKNAKKLCLKYDCFGHSNIFKKIVHMVFSTLSFFISGKKLHKNATKIERFFIGCDENNDWFCPQDFGTTYPIRFSKSLFMETKRMRFGPLLVNCPTKYIDFLELAYGHDWRTPINRNPSNDFETYFIKK